MPPLAWGDFFAKLAPPVKDRESPQRMRRFASQLNDWLLDRDKGVLSLLLADTAPVDLRLVGRTLIHAALVGLAGGLMGAAFFAILEVGQWLLLDLLVGYRPLRAAGEPVIAEGGPDFRPWLLVILPALGGLVAGAISRYAPEVRGGGADQAIAAFHEQSGRIRRRVLWARPLASIFTLASGGAGGREGPTFHFGAAAGVLVGDLLRVGPRERRILLVAGIAAGISAVFRTPLGAALLAVEVLYRDGFESDALIPAVFASVVSYSVATSLFGESTLFAHGGLSFPFQPGHLPLYALLALLIAPISALFIDMLRATSKVLERMPGPDWLRPAYGGLALGVFATLLLVVVGSRIAEPGHGFGILGGGYGGVQVALTGADWLPLGWGAVAVLAAMALAKLVAASLTIGSGGSAGDFAPSLAIGGMLGGAFGYAAQILFEDPTLHPGAFALVGMGIFYGGIAHVPLSALVLVCELAGTYDLLVPLMLTQGIVFVALRKRTLYPAQPRTQGESPVHRETIARSILANSVVRDVMTEDPRPVVFDEQTTAREMFRHHHTATWQEIFPVRGADGKLVGMIPAELLRVIATQEEVLEWSRAADLMETLVAVRPDDDLRTAAERLVTSRARSLPVVDEDGKLLGTLDEARIAESLLGRRPPRIWTEADPGTHGKSVG